MKIKILGSKVFTLPKDIVFNNFLEALFLIKLAKPFSWGRLQDAMAKSIT